MRHTLVWVRSAPSLEAAKVGCQLKGAIVEAVNEDPWIRLTNDKGWMLVDGREAGLSFALLQRVSEAEHREAMEKRAVSGRELRDRVDEISNRALKQLSNKQVSKNQVRKMVAEHLVAAEFTKAHHAATAKKAFKSAPSSSLRVQTNDEKASSSSSSSSSSREVSERLARRLRPDLEKKNIAIIDDFFSAEDVESVRAELRRLDDEGRLAQTLQTLTKTRDDRVAFLSSMDAFVFEVQRGLASAIGTWRGRHLYPAESTMAAVYAPRGRYRRHRDNNLTDTNRPQNPRALTAIFYATPDDWHDARDQGALRFYNNDDGLSTDSPSDNNLDDYTDVAPRPGRLVVFDSFFAHEVRPPHRERAALTFWIYADYAEDFHDEASSS